ncbi:hypothetical protein HK102_010328, partial [Quaeritorhiza haematococci]
GDRLVANAWKLWGGLDAWVHFAGADVLTGDGAKLSFEAKLDLLWEVDVVAAIRLCRDVGRRMVDAGGGSIVTMGWDQAETGMEGDSGETFAATKGAVMAFTRSLALSLAPSVRVNGVAPGWIQTAWGETAPPEWQDRVLRETPLKRWGTPEDVARVTAFLVGPASGFLTGEILRVDGGAPAMRFLLNDDTVELRVSGRHYPAVARWHAERIKRLAAERKIRTHADVDAELAKMKAVDQRVKVLGEFSIEIDGDVFDFNRRTASSIREAIADGTFKYEPPEFSGWLTAQELEATWKLMRIKTRRGRQDFYSWMIRSDEQKAAIQVQIDEVTGRDARSPGSSPARSSAWTAARSADGPCTSRKDAMNLPALLTLSIVVVASAPDPKPPNIVVFLVDDMDLTSCSPYGATPHVPTPNMERIAADGMRFTHAFVASPSCAPSRAALLTGLDPMRNGSMLNHSRPKPDVKLWPAYFRELGYETAAIGKTAHYAQVTTYGFDHASHYTYHDDACVEAAADWLAKRESDKPLCLI